MDVALGNAPVSYGVFEMTVGTERFMAGAERLLYEVESAGYAGIDLGPAGYLAQAAGGNLGDALRRHGLGLCGGYLELPFHEPDAVREALPVLDALLDEFDTARDQVAGPAPRPTLAASASPGHQRRPGQAWHDPSIGLDEAGWLRFAAGLELVVGRCRERGYEPTFHPHAGTWVEAPREIERVLASSDVGLCLDTGHLMVGGGDPLEAVAAWGPRINQVHLKDARLDVLQDLIDSGAGARAIWTRRVFTALGRGDLDVRAFLAALDAAGYSGWIVVEQDVLANSERDFEVAVADQRANRQVLAGLGLA